MKTNIKTYSVDEFGVRNYSTAFLLFVSIVVLYCIIALLSFPLLHVERDASDSNIKSYADAFWTLQMSASTIGFGDHFPVSSIGRIIVAAMFYIGVGLVGYIGAQFVDRFVGFSDTNVKNRELRRQNEAILEHNKELETKVDLLLRQIEKVIASKE